MVNQVLISLEKVFVESSFLGLGISFLAGVVASFSPCIYPLIPITLGIVGVGSATTRLKGLIISSIFVLGMATIYTTLGIIASLTGKFLWSFFINPVTFIFLAAVLFFLGISTLADITINIPFFSFNYEASKNKNLFSIFILGMVSSLGLIPCSFPVLGAILSLISLKQNILYGGSALFLFSLGFGTILIILGTFATLIKKLPKQGFWLMAIKKIVGVTLIIMGVYFLLKFITLLR